MAAVLESPRCRARVWLASSEEEADREEAAQLWQERFEQLCAETRGVVEKLSRSWRSPSSMGTKQLVVWQPRLLFCEADGICYQKLAADDTPMGEPTKVKFADINGIEELRGHSAEFELRCAGQELIFKAASEDACTTLVLNLRQLQELQGRYAAAEVAHAAADAEAASPHTSVRSSVQSASSRSSVHSPEA